MSDPIPERRWFRWSLKTLFVLILLLAIPLGWTTAQFKWIRDRRKALHGLEQSRRAFILDWESSFVHDPDDKLPWSLRLFGEDSVRQIFIRHGRESELEPLRILFPEADVTADKSRIVGMQSPPAG
jgi:hypothetical protein